MAVTIEQKPLFDILPIGQQIMFAVSMNTIVATKFKVKFVAEVHVSTHAIVPGTTNTLIGTYKTTPNNEGVGIFDLRPILETFVSPDNLGSTIGSGSKYKTSVVPHPIHLIDEYSRNENSVRLFAIRFKVEYADSSTGNINPPDNGTDSDQYTMFNGVLQYDDILTLQNDNYGYNLDTNNFYPLPSQAKFLSNAPFTQYARLTDYGTFPFLNFVPYGDRVTSMTLTYYWDGGSSSEQVAQNYSNGGVTNYAVYSPNFLLYFGGFPANLQNTSTVFAAAIANGITHYTIRSNDVSGAIGETYTINILCPNERGYEGIRLTWLNQWGVWDYYTFNKKSIKSIKTKRTSYTQMEGTWNESTFKINGYKGGKKSFRVNSTEIVKMNSDFLTESESVWFEELINSTEVYILKGFSADTANTITNKYVEPVTLKTSSYVRKTIANDKLIQYTIQIQKSKMPRTQSV